MPPSTCRAIFSIRHRQARNNGAGQGAQENEDHQHDEYDRERQFEFDIGDRGADSHCAVAENSDVERRGEGGF
jgi:hypothetical protein